VRKAFALIVLRVAIAVMAMRATAIPATGMGFPSKLAAMGKTPTARPSPKNTSVPTAATNGIVKSIRL
jgi:hypothetical protein